MRYRFIYAPEVYEDLQQAIDFYNSRQKDLGSRFFTAVKKQLSLIKSNASGFQVRYNEVRCSPINKFPYTIHYKIFQDTKTIKVIAVFCDYSDPDNWENRSK